MLSELATMYENMIDQTLNLVSVGGPNRNESDKDREIR